ncbi:MAG: hypothetical protein LBN71_11565 [Tannerella sp.]|jgi:hypothetical protein|nr:hypothetical protein [Tannerella sp.]
MKNEALYNTLLLDELRKKIPQNPKLVQALVDFLCIEKEAVYRRLRGDVPFSFHEIATLSKNLGFSIDNIIGLDVQKSRPVQLSFPDFVAPKESDYFLLEKHLDAIQLAVKSGNSEMACVTNVLPQELFTGYQYLSKFNIFRWLYHYRNDRLQAFSTLVIPDRVLNLFRKQFIETKKIEKTYYIFDTSVYKRFVHAINYFRNIQLIEQEDVLYIKDELMQLLNYTEELTISGRFKETGRETYFYITDTDITTSYYYMNANGMKYSLIRTFLMTSATSMDEQTFDEMKNWVRSAMKVSTLITEASEKQRILYFECQREIINEL